MAGVTYLILSGGNVYKGIGFGAPAPTTDELIKGKRVFVNTGEVVFNTAMSGYHEVLTDPSYTGQIVTMTYPHMGNYGSSDEWNESGPEDRAQRRKVKVAGFVLRSLYRGPVPEGRITLDSYLSTNGIPGITELDTRRLTLDLRDNGARIGVLVRPAAKDGELSTSELEDVKTYLASYPAMEGMNLIADVGLSCASESAAEVFGKVEHPQLAIKAADLLGIPQGLRVALIDCGAKANIVRELRAFGARVIIFPAHAKAEDILASGVEGVLISNGPGDPAVLDHQIGLVRSLLGNTVLTGICLGHQLISLGIGATTYKMKFGHHGLNHPVRDEIGGRVFVTSQNHGFAVKEETLPAKVKVWFRNANDRSIEGIISEELKVYTAQFHPESAPGPNDSLWIFGAFLRAMASQGAH